LAEARDQFAKAAEINPGMAIARIKLGITLQEMGHVDEAVEAFRAAFDLPETCVDMHYKLGLMHTDRQRFSEYIRRLEEAAGDDHGEQIRAGLALSLQCMGLMDRAAATWRSLCKIHHAGA
jgi:tetratricopeptide (TPR) repeat protein